MAQKVNPIAVRLHLNRCSNSFWFSDYYYAQLLSQDYLLRNYIQSIRPPTNSQWGFRIGRCIIHRYPKKALFHIFYQIPRLDGSQRAATPFSVNSFSGRGVNSRTAIVEKSAQESEACSRWSRLALATFLEKRRKSFAFPLCDLRHLREAEAHCFVTKSRKLAPKVSSVCEAIHGGKRIVSADTPLLAQPISGSTANQYASVFVDLSICCAPFCKGALGSFFGYRPGVISFVTVRLSSFDYHPIEYYLQDAQLPMSVTEMSLRQTGYRPLHFPFRNLAQSWINLHWLALRYLFWQKYCISAFQNPVCRPLTNIFNSLAKTTQLSEFVKRKDLGSKRRASESELESFAKGTVLEARQGESAIDRNRVSAKPSGAKNVSTFTDSEFRKRRDVALVLKIASSTSSHLSPIGAGVNPMSSPSQERAVPKQENDTLCSSEFASLRKTATLPSVALFVEKWQHKRKYLELPHSEEERGNELAPLGDELTQVPPIGGSGRLRREQLRCEKNASFFASFFLSSTTSKKNTTCFSLRSFVASQRYSKNRAINSNKLISLEVYKEDRPGTEGREANKHDSVFVAPQANELCQRREAKRPNGSLLAKGHEMRKTIVKNSNYWRNIESVLSLEASNDVQIIPVRSTSLFQSASLLAQEICVQLMQKQSFPKIWKNISRSLNRQKPKVIKGMRISCSGRLNGAEIAKTESRQWGETSLHVFQDKIDYAKKFSLSPYGILGVKVWISYSE